MMCISLKLSQGLFQGSKVNRLSTGQFLYPSNTSALFSHWDFSFNFDFCGSDQIIVWRAGRQAHIGGEKGFLGFKKLQVRKSQKRPAPPSLLFKQC